VEKTGSKPDVSPNPEHPRYPMPAPFHAHLRIPRLGLLYAFQVYFPKRLLLKELFILEKKDRLAPEDALVYHLPRR
jgi:hypothetical protein